MLYYVQAMPGKTWHPVKSGLSSDEADAVVLELIEKGVPAIKLPQGGNYKPRLSPEEHRRKKMQDIERVRLAAHIRDETRKW